MKPAMLFLDIETAPDVVWTWGLWQANAIAVKEHWYVLSFAAKWRGDDTLMVNGLDDYKGYKGGKSTELKLLNDVWTLLDEADIVVAHNGRDFDVKKLNARFIEYGFAPPSPYKVVDTKSDLAGVAKYSSNKLDWLMKQFKIGAKMPHEGFDLWQGCMDGDKKAWKTMKAYNAHDVVLLEALYNKISSWIPQPNAGLYEDRPTCPNPGCDGGPLIKRGLARAITRVYQRYQCDTCGTWSRSVKSEKGLGAQIVRT